MASARIIDHGEGISPENLQRVFTPYFTTKNTGDGKRGFGLGLAIARKIVHLHGGNLSITSKEKSGTTVQVDLPNRLRPGPTSAAARGRLAAGHGGRMRTLLVIGPQHRPGRRGARDAGFLPLPRHRARPNCREEELRLTGASIDACVLDADLTTVEPIRDIERLRRLLPQCPLILYASDSHRSWEEEAYLLGVSHILSKPVRGRLLNSVLDRLFAVTATPEEQAALAPRRPRPEEQAGGRGAAGWPRRMLRDCCAILPRSFATALDAESLLREFLLVLREILGRQPGGDFSARLAARAGWTGRGGPRRNA